ncbi:MAG: hypothetical protein M1457_08585 [bacterium]|nr:hypothetical protein [bacterium]
MEIKADWLGALAAARRGDLAPARAARATEPSGVLADYFYGRALVEAGDQLDEAIAALRGAVARDPANPLMIHTLALGLVRRNEREAAREANRIWRRHGLPHDLDLLGLAALTFEMQLRPLPPQPVMTDLPWPARLPRPEPPESPESPGAAGGPAPPRPEASDLAAENPSARDKMARTAVPKKAGWHDRRRLNRALARLETAYADHRGRDLLEQAAALVEEGLESAELHLLAGMAAEEAGLVDRARAHLARAAGLEPKMLISRTCLGRVYWRAGWFELALALWRSLPVEGPYDHGRHYHLALGHEALGDHVAALEAMRFALDHFFFDTRHFHIDRAAERWRLAVAAADPSGAGE